MWRDLPRDVCLKADYKDMLTNAAVQVVCTQTVAQHGHRKTHTDAPDAHKHTHTRTIPLRNCPVLVFKFDSDLTDLGHLALAAEQTAWLHLCACVCFHICVCEHSCWRHFSEQADKLGGEGQKDAHHDLTAGNMQDAKDRPAFFVRCLPSHPAKVSATSCTKCVACFFILKSTSTHYLEVSTQKKKFVIHQILPKALCWFGNQPLWCSRKRDI